MNETQTIGAAGAADRRSARGPVGLAAQGFAAAAVLLAGACSSAPARPALARVLVDPVLLVPLDAPTPPASYGSLAMRQIEWAQARYRELLGGKCTFGIAKDAPRTVASRHRIAELEKGNDGGAEAALLELMARDGVDRLSCPYIYVVMFVGTGTWPGGGARPINGGIDTGGGIVVLSADALVTAPNFQSTLQHELGHAFGLPHVDVYGYDMLSSPSLMSYNPNHHTHGFTPSATPGALIPEDLRALALNHRVFPGLTPEALPPVPPDYKLAPIVLLGPMSLTGEPDYAGPSIVP